MKLLSLAWAAMALSVFRPATGAAESAERFLRDFFQHRGLTNHSTANIPHIVNGVTNSFRAVRFPTNAFGVLTNGSTGLFFPTNRVLSLPAAKSLAPGVYKTEPFACIVVVPGPHPDERMVVNPGKAETKMPMIEPPLKFVPLK